MTTSILGMSREDYIDTLCQVIKVHCAGHRIVHPDDIAEVATAFFDYVGAVASTVYQAKNYRDGTKHPAGRPMTSTPNL